jgi:hypothetical protein
MIIWSGFGFLVAVITFAACLAMNFLLDAQFGKGYYSSHLWAVGVALMIGGVLSSVADFAMRPRGGREFIDAETGKHVTLGASQHTLHWAGLVVAAIGLVVMVKGLLT